MLGAYYTMRTLLLEAKVWSLSSSLLVPGAYPSNIYRMEYYSAIKKNTFESVPVRWMKLEPIIQSEVSQKEKHQYNILTHIYGIEKDGNDDPICKTAKETQMYRTAFWTLWERARVGWFGRMALKHVNYCM